MKISGFTMVKNAVKLYYPIKQSISSILPLVDEFVVALGQGDEDDQTRKEIETIHSKKIRIIETVWDTDKYPNGTENAHQTDIAKEACTGDWLFYLQADEVVHEQDIPHIREMCLRYLHHKKVEGFLFKYFHFWGDYDHYINSHGWYQQEIRIIRNDPDIHSFRSAQSFKRIPGFDGKSYRRKEGTYKLHVKPINAHIYHYGWVRPPRLMQKKQQSLDTIHKGKEKVEPVYRHKPEVFDYGRIDTLPRFKGSHPGVMKGRIDKFYWKDQLTYYKRTGNRAKHKHKRPLNRLITFIEQKILGGRQLFSHSNWITVKDQIK